MHKSHPCFCIVCPQNVRAGVICGHSAKTVVESDREKFSNKNLSLSFFKFEVSVVKQPS